jgi:hypothetical protein
MNKAMIDQLLELISEIVREDEESWREKAKKIKDQATDDERIDLDEFCSWFTEEEEEEEE